MTTEVKRPPDHSSDQGGMDKRASPVLVSFVSDKDLEVTSGQGCHVVNRYAVAVIETNDAVQGPVLIRIDRLNVEVGEGGDIIDLPQFDGVPTLLEILDVVRVVARTEDERIVAAPNRPIRSPEVAPHMIFSIRAADKTVVSALGAASHGLGIAVEVVSLRIRPTCEGIIAAPRPLPHDAGVPPESVRQGRISTSETVIP